MFIATLSVSGNLVPIYALFETLQLIVHMPLVSINLPGSVTQFIMPIADLIQFNMFGANDAIKERWGISKDDLAYN